MMKFKRFKYPELFVISIMAVIFAIASLFIHPKKSGGLSTVINLPNSFGNDIKITRYNDKGQLSSQLYAQHMQLDSKTNQIIFTRPFGYFYSANQAPWFMSSERAFANHDFSEIQLQNHVLFKQINNANGNQTEIATSWISLNTKTQIATTDQPVKLIQSGKNQSMTVINTVGLVVDQKTGNIKLLSQARGYYAPPKT